MHSHEAATCRTCWKQQHALADRFLCHWPWANTAYQPHTHRGGMTRTNISPVAMRALLFLQLAPSGCLRTSACFSVSLWMATSCSGTELAWPRMRALKGHALGTRALGDQCLSATQGRGWSQSLVGDKVIGTPHLEAALQSGTPVIGVGMVAPGSGRLVARAGDILLCSLHWGGCGWGPDQAGACNVWEMGWAGAGHRDHPSTLSSRTLISQCPALTSAPHCLP